MWEKLSAGGSLRRSFQKAIIRMPICIPAADEWEMLRWGWVPIKAIHTQFVKLWISVQCNSEDFSAKRSWQKELLYYWLRIFCFIGPTFAETLSEVGQCFSSFENIILNHECWPPAWLSIEISWSLTGGKCMLHQSFMTTALQVDSDLSRRSQLAPGSGQRLGRPAHLEPPYSLPLHAHSVVFNRSERQTDSQRDAGMLENWGNISDLIGLARKVGWPSIVQKCSCKLYNCTAVVIHLVPVGPIGIDLPSSDQMV